MIDARSLGCTAARWLSMASSEIPAPTDFSSSSAPLSKTQECCSAGSCGRTEFTFEGQAIRQYEEFFALRVARFEPTASGWNEIERRSMLGHRWWTLDELALTTEVVYPERFAEIVRGLLAR